MNQSASSPQSVVSSPQSTVSRWLPWLEIALLGLVLAVAALYRLNMAPLDVAPPGCFSDEAHYGLDALAVLDGHHAVFFPDNGGREPLFIYLAAGSIALFGRTVTALRLVSALAGVATVGLTFLAAREMFRRSLGREAALAVATLAGLLLAVSQWHVTFSRIAFRASTTPLLEVLAFWLLWRGLNAHAENRRAAPWFALSGAALGLCLYTYLASRFVPVVLIIFVVLWALTRHLSHTPILPHSTVPWRDLALLALVVLVVLAPLGAYFALHPDDFLHRAGEASVFNPAWNRGNPLGAFADSVVKAVGMLFWAGDPNWRHNIAGLPILGPIGILFLAGLLLALLQIRRLPYLFAVVWLVVMMLPSALTAEGIPNSLRNLAAAPVVYIFPALALVRVWITLSHVMRQTANGKRRTSRITYHVSRLTFAGLAATILLLTAALTFHDYFVVWANHPITAKAMNADMRMVEVAEYMNARADGDTAFLLLNTYEHPAVAYLYDGDSPYAFLPSGDVPATVRQLCQGRSRLVTIRWDWLDPQAMTAENFTLALLDAYATRTGEETGPGFRALTYQLPLEVLFPIALRHRDAQFGDGAQLTGYLFRAPGTGPGLGPDTASPDSDAWVVLRWRLLGDGNEPPPLKVTLRLLDADGQLVAQLDKALTGPESDHREARPGDTITDYYRLSIPPGTPPGTHTLAVGAYPPDTLQLLPVTFDTQTDILFTLGLVTVTAP